MSCCAVAALSLAISHLRPPDFAQKFEPVTAVAGCVCINVHDLFRGRDLIGGPTPRMGSRELAYAYIHVRVW